MSEDISRNLNGPIKDNISIDKSSIPEMGTS